MVFGMDAEINGHIVPVIIHNWQPLPSLFYNICLYPFYSNFAWVAPYQATLFDFPPPRNILQRTPLA